MDNNFHITEDRQVELLINQMESCPDLHHHLQVFLHRDSKADCISGYEFLMVTPTSFGKVLIQDLTVDGKNVIIQIFDCTTRQVGNVRININDENPSVLFVSWKDVKKLVFEECSTKNGSDELLELEY